MLYLLYPHTCRLLCISLIKYCEEDSNADHMFRIILNIGYAPIITIIIIIVITIIIILSNNEESGIQNLPIFFNFIRQVT